LCKNRLLNYFSFFLRILIYDISFLIPNISALNASTGLQNDFNPKETNRELRSVMRAISIASDISSPTNDVYKRSPPPVFSPISLFTVPQASTPPRPHSHDLQRRATFGTTSPCTYGEGLASPCRRWPLVRVIVPGDYDSRSCIYLRARARAHATW